MKKSTFKMSTKSATKLHKAPKIGQKYVRKTQGRVSVPFIEKQALSNLRQMVASMPDKKTVEKYEVLAGMLSTAAKLSNGHVWSWRYVMSVAKGSIRPGKKFIQAVMLCAQKNNYCKQWFYFVCRRNVAAVFNKCIMADIIKTNMRNMGYKQVTFTRYMEVKRKAVN